MSETRLLSKSEVIKLTTINVNCKKKTSLNPSHGYSESNREREKYDCLVRLLG